MRFSIVDGDSATIRRFPKMRQKKRRVEIELSRISEKFYARIKCWTAEIGCLRNADNQIRMNVHELSTLILMGVLCVVLSG